MQILKNRIAAMKLPAAIGKRIQGFGILNVTEILPHAGGGFWRHFRGINQFGRLS
jgi:hypothetical protein